MTPAVRAAEAAGVEFELLEYGHDPRAESFGLEAAQALAQDPASVFKTLLAEVDGRLTVALVPVHRTLDLKALAAACGAKRARMAVVADAERATGYVAGGISPLGQKRRLATVVDRSVESLPRVHVSGGRRGLEIALAPADLLALSRATLADIAR